MAGALLTLSSFAIAGEYPVTPASLGDWRLVGATQTDLGHGSALSLPAGTTLARTFEAGIILVHSVSSPVFADSPTDWPLLQVGPAALALIRNGNRGELVLLVDSTARTLPFAVTVDDGGRGAAPLEIALGYSPASRRGIVMLGNQIEEFNAAAGTSEISLSAGQNEPWAFDSLTAFVPDAAVSSSTNGNADSSFAASKPGVLQNSAEIIRRMETTWLAAEADRQASPGRAPAETAAASPPITLEIFTPPAVRNDPASIRREIARQKKL